MSFLLQVAVCFVPLIATLIVFALLIKDFSVFYGLLSCFLGLLCFVPIQITQTLLHHIPYLQQIFGVFFIPLLVNGLAEEGIKLCFVALVPQKTKTLNVYFVNCILLGLCLCCFESVIYVLHGKDDFILRLFTAGALHSFCSGLLGLGVWGIKKHKQKTKAFSAIFMAIFIHAIYDFFAMLPINITVFNIPLKYFSIVTLLFALTQLHSHRQA